MKTRFLGNIEVSEIGMGCMGFSHGYGQIPSREYSIEAIRMAYDKCGCTFFDTAEVYGDVLYGFGHNENIVGEALNPMRKDVVIATKFHPEHEEELSKDIYSLFRSHLDRSLHRLRTDYIDLYYLHRLDERLPLEAVADTMGRLIKEGLIRGWGMSQVGVENIAKAHVITPLSAVQNIYSMVERGIEKEVIPFCIENNIGVVPFSPIASGLLSGKVTTETKFGEKDDVRKFVPQLSSKEAIEGNMPIVDLLRSVAVEKYATPAQVSLAWMLAKWSNIVPIPGSKNKERIAENLGAANVELTSEEFKTLDNALNSLQVYGHRGFEESAQKSFGNNWKKQE